MFWYLHYAAKTVLALALAGMAYGLYGYATEHWVPPAEEWVHTLRRADFERLEILGTNVAPVIGVPSGDTVLVRDETGDKLVFRIAGTTAPPRLGQKYSPAWKAYERSRTHLLALALSNRVQVAYTFFVPRAGGVGGVYLGGTNLAIPLLESGMVVVHDASLKSLPLPEQVRLLAAEKAAREAKRGFWAERVHPAYAVRPSKRTRRRNTFRRARPRGNRSA